MPLRPAFQTALTLLATACERVRRRGKNSPVLVGGAAVEIMTGGRIASGDFDLVTPAQSELFEELERLGFERPGGSFLDRSLWHPESQMSVQVVSGLLMDGRADLDRILIVEIGHDLSISLIPPEDLIADRLGQAFSVPFGRIREDMKDQGVILYLLAEKLDLDYLNRRIREETSGAADLGTLARWADEVRNAE